MTDKVSYGDLLDLTASVLRKGFGYVAEEARATAEVLCEADARGIASHGVSRLAFYRKNLDQGHCRPGSEPKVVWETPASLVVDGNAGVGPYVADFAVKKTMAKAGETGACLCAVRNSNHYGIAGFWAEKIAWEDMLGLAFTNTYIAGVPTFGRLRILGTNPIAAAFPLGGGSVFLLDMATTTVTHGKVELCDRRGEPMPKGWVVDETGREVTAATAFEKNFYEKNFGGHLYIGGAGEASGGHKGFGLALLVELLCSGLSLGAASLSTYTRDGAAGITHFFAALRLDLLGSPNDIKEHASGILGSVRGSERALGEGRIYIHGEKEAEARALSMREGVWLDSATKAMLLELSKKHGLPVIKGLSDEP